jgi:hypothetical protein
MKNVTKDGENVMKWKLTELALIAEIVAAVGVIFSLIFVGFQINDGSNETRAATIQAASDAESFMLVTLIEHSGTWDKVVIGAPLDSGEETRKGILLFNLMMTENENRYRQFKSGYLDTQSWDSRLENLRSIVKMPMFKKWRASLGGKGHTAEFLHLVDELSEES